MDAHKMTSLQCSQMVGSDLFCTTTTKGELMPVSMHSMLQPEEDVLKGKAC